MLKILKKFLKSAFYRRFLIKKHVYNHFLQGFQLHFQLVLSEKQSLCVDMAMKGHNFTIIGKAGTGKSFIAKEIMRSFIAAGKTFQIVCSTGVSCEVYKREEWPINNAKVLNSFFGIGLADAPFENIVRDAVEKCDRYLLNVQCIIWLALMIIVILI